jgi:hypothetical protein
MTVGLTDESQKYDNQICKGGQEDTKGAEKAMRASGSLLDHRLVQILDNTGFGLQNQWKPLSSSLVV